MSAPSALHEDRVRTLQTLATLAGFTLSGGLLGGTRPDVLGLDVDRRRVLVGDAKATESAGTYSTRLRLTSYFRAANRWHGRGFEVAALLCVPSDLSDHWLRLLLKTAKIAGAEPVPLPSLDLGNGESLVSVTIHP